MKSYLRAQYKEIGAYLKRNKRFPLIVAMVIVEVIVYSALKTPANTNYEEYVAESMPAYSNLFTFIFFENTKSTGKILLSGIVPACFGSLTVLCLTMLDLTATVKQLLLSYSPHMIFLSILPHGIFELSAMLGAVLFSSLLSKEITLAIAKVFVPKGWRLSKKISDQRIKNIATIIKAWCLVIVPLLVVAAMIEVTISPVVMEIVMK